MRVTKTEFIFPATGGERSALHGLDLPANATNVEFNPETLYLVYSTQAEGEEAVEYGVKITQDQVDKAIATIFSKTPNSLNNL